MSPWPSGTACSPLGAYLADASVRVELERALGPPAEEIALRWARAVEFLFERADEARALLGTA